MKYSTALSLAFIAFSLSLVLFVNYISAEPDETLGITLISGAIITGASGTLFTLAAYNLYKMNRK